MRRWLLLTLLAIVGFGAFGCGEDQKAAPVPKETGYVAPDVPKAAGDGSAAAKAPAK